jgi:hypothetical protein
MVPGQITSGHISPADGDTFTFTGTSNDVVTAALVRTDGLGTPYLYLYDPLGTLVYEGMGSSTAANVAYFAGVRLTRSGTYTFVVIEGSLAFSYDYNLCMFKSPGPNVPEPGEGAEVMSPGENRLAHITPGDLDAYVIPAIAYDTISVHLRTTGGPGQNLVVQLVAPDGTVVATALGQASATINAHCVPQTGNYQIVIFDGSLSEAFDYEVTVGVGPLVPPSSGVNQYLAIVLCGNEVIVRWETNSTGFVLESRLSLDGANWEPVVAPQQVIADHFYVFDGVATNRTKFYRLRCPTCP